MTPTIGPVKKTAAIVVTSAIIGFSSYLHGQDTKMSARPLSRPGQTNQMFNKVENSSNVRQYNTFIVNNGDMTTGPRRSSMDELSYQSKVKAKIGSGNGPKPKTPALTPPAGIRNNDTLNVRVIDDGKKSSAADSAKIAVVPVVKSITDVPDWIKYALGAAGASLLAGLGALWASRRRREERQPQPRPGTTNVTMGPDGRTNVNSTGPANVTVEPNGNVNVQQAGGNINVNRPAQNQPGQANAAQ